jgi:hypothetical protein
MMSFFGFIGGLLGGFWAWTKAPKAPQPLPTATRDDAAAQVKNDDAIRRRQGAAADIVTGKTGAEAARGTVGRLVVGS